MIDENLYNQMVKILEIFYKNFEPVIKQMRLNDHNYDKENINPFHMEGDTWSHTMLCLNSLRTLPFTGTLFQFECLIIIILTHDIGKIHAIKRNDEKKRVSFYNHGFQSVQYAVDFLDILFKENILSKNDQSLYKSVILPIVSNHIDFYAWDDNKRGKIIGLNKDLYECFYVFLQIDQNFGSITKQYPIDIDFPNFHTYEKEDIDVPEIVLVCGVPGVGKDTYAESKDGAIVSFDNIRIREFMKNFDTSKMDDIELYDMAWKNTKRLNLLNIMKKEITDLLNDGCRKIFICNTSCNRKARRKLMNMGLKNVKYSIVYLTESRKEIYKRNNERSSKLISNEIADKFIQNQQIPHFGECDDILIF